MSEGSQEDSVLKTVELTSSHEKDVVLYPLGMSVMISVPPKKQQLQQRLVQRRVSVCHSFCNSSLQVMSFDSLDVEHSHHHR